MLCNSLTRVLCEREREVKSEQSVTSSVETKIIAKRFLEREKNYYMNKLVIFPTSTFGFKFSTYHFSQTFLESF